MYELTYKNENKKVGTIKILFQLPVEIKKMKITDLYQSFKYHMHDKNGKYIFFLHLKTLNFKVFLENLCNKIQFETETLQLTFGLIQQYTVSDGPIKYILLS